MESKRQYFYRRYPRLTMLVIMLLLGLGVLKVSDVVLYGRALQKIAEAEKLKEEQPAWVFSPINRIIRLRELRPNMAGFVQPDKDYLEGTENLVDKKYFVHTDSNGFLINPLQSQNEEEKIVFLGGSTTECLYVTETMRFPFLVAEKIADQTGTKVTSKSSGVSGNNSMHSINILLNKVLPERPRVVVLMESINDLNVMLYEKTYWNRNVSRSLIMDTAMVASYNSVFPTEKIEKPEGLLKDVFPYLSLRYSILKNQLAQRGKKTVVNEWANTAAGDITFNQQHIEENFRSSIKTFVSVCRAWNIVPVLMTQQNRIVENPDRLVLNGFKPLEKRGISYEVYRQEYLRFNQIIRDIADEEGVLLIDLDKEVPKKSEYIYDVVHVNDKGSELIADIVSSELRDLFRK
jgi:lysophospholipase L1-like esterase